MKYSDPIDQGSHLADLHNQSSLEAHRIKNKPEQEKVKVIKDGEEAWVWPVTNCKDCDEELLPGRLELGRVRCVDCQTAKEQEDKHYARR